MPLSQNFGHLLCSDDVQCTARPQVQALLVQTPVHHLDTLFVADVHRAVQHFDLLGHVLRHPALPDALGDATTRALLQLPAARDVAVQDAARRICQIALNPAIADILQVPRDAGQCAARPRSARKRVQVPVRLRPDLRARRLDVPAPVGDVVELVRPDRATVRVLLPRSLRVALRLPVVVVGVVEGHRRHGVHLGAQQPQQIDLALALRVGHVDDEPVAAAAANVREPDACVAGGALDDGAARVEEAALFGVSHQVEGGTVLDAATWVLEFGFAVDVAVEFAGEGAELDKGSVADC